MRYPGAEKLEIIKLVEGSHLPAKQTLNRLGIARRTFYRWYDRYLEGGPDALEDKPSRPNRVWNRIPGKIQNQIVEMALERSDLSPRELAVITALSVERGGKATNRHEGKCKQR